MRHELRGTASAGATGDTREWRLLTQELAQTVLRLVPLLEIQQPSLAASLRQLLAEPDDQTTPRQTLSLLAALNDELSQLKPRRRGAWHHWLNRLARPRQNPPEPAQLVPATVRANLLELLDHLHPPDADEQLIFRLRRELLREVRLKELPRLLAELTDGLSAAQAARADPPPKLSQRGFHQRLKHEVAQWHRYHVPLSLVVANADDLAQINRRLGEAAGDSVLHRIERLLRTHLRDSDHLTRLEGMEFVAVMPQTNLQQATHAADKLRQAVGAQPLRVGCATVAVTISCGVAELVARDTPKELLRRAEAALAEAKDAGKNQVVAVRAVKPH